MWGNDENPPEESSGSVSIQRRVRPRETQRIIRRGVSGEFEDESRPIQVPFQGAKGTENELNPSRVII